MCSSDLHDRPRAYYRAVAYGDARHDHAFKPRPHVVAEHDIALVVPRLVRPEPVFPLFLEDGEGIGRERAQRMVCAVEQKFRAAGNRTEFAYLKFIVVDGVVVEYVVPFKLPWVVHEVVVESKITNFNVRVCDYVFQIHNRIVPFAGIYLFAIRNSHK